MRPVRRGPSPRQEDFLRYEDAKIDLVARMGPFCSYCERFIATGLEVEHIQPKGLPQYLGLIGRWENFLLACKNCNTTKGHKDVGLADILLPDRDNTFAAFVYSADGQVNANPALKVTRRTQARATLSLTGLDKAVIDTLDQNGKLVALDRVSQRMEAWSIAEVSRDDIMSDPESQPLRRATVRTALASGFFSIWMTVFAADLNMRMRFIGAFAGTRESRCFDETTSNPVVAPNPDGLLFGGKA
jgi:uncharacterized protein (TIGR02646 family)